VIRSVVAAGGVAALLLATSIARAQPAPAPAPPPRHTLVPPRLVSEPDVPYPAGAHGDTNVYLDVTIDRAGRVVDAKPLAEHEPFSGAAARAVRAWKYEPALRDGAPVAAKIRVELDFHEPRPAPAEGEGEDAREGERAAEAAASAGTKPAAPRAPEPPQEVRVRGARPDPGRTATLARTEVRQIPGTFGDPFRAIEIMPGVTPIVSGLPFFFVRGAPPGNVGYFLDGVRVPLLFHVGVGPSVIHPALIERVELYPGGYPARFGRFAGGVVSGETVAPDPHLHGEYNARVFDAGALAETGFDGGRGAVMLGGRYSYTAAILSLFSPDTTLDYWDYQARAGYDVTKDDRASVFAFGSYDFLGQKTPEGDTLTVFGTQFHRVDARWDHRLGDRGTIRVAATLGLDRSQQDVDRFVRDRIAGARTEIAYRLGERATLRAGTDLQVDGYDVVLGGTPLAPSTSGVANLFPSRTDLAFGTRGDVVVEPFRGFQITPGVRLDYFASAGTTAVGLDPRLSTRTQITPKLALLAALGIAHQPPAFVVPLPGFQPGGLTGGLQEAYQESTGLELELGGGTVATASVYHNAFYDMSDPLSVSQPEISGCAPGTFPGDTLAGDRGRQPTGTGGGCGVPRFPEGTIGPDRTGGRGEAADSTGAQRNRRAFEVRTRGSAYGLELMLERKLTSRVGGFVSYTLSRSTRTSDGRTYVATFDRTHVANAALAFDLGRRWRAGTRLTFYTGLPKAPDPTTNATRLSPFYRIDLRLEKRWQLGRTSWISFVAEFMNVTLHKEAISTTCTLEGCDEDEIGPVSLPSLGVEGGF
jgi:hypothetical protein